jgi:surface polysaccharide O-acyltransferase-like enzyme
MERQAVPKTAAKAKSISGTRLLYIDNLRILLTVLVILQHLSIGYGAPGDWYYNEQGTLGTISQILMTIFVAINQAFFMGFFFMISSYFLPGSIERKGSGRYMQDRLMRLGIPLLFYMVVLNPLTKYGLWRFYGNQGSLMHFLFQYPGNLGGLSAGPLWFVETLLIFSLIYLLWSQLGKKRTAAAIDSKVPGNLAIAIFALGVGVVTFVVRIWLPVGTTISMMNIQPPHFPQYIALFIAGIMAYRRNWFVNMPDGMGHVWKRAVYGLIVLFFAMFIAGGALEGNIDPFMGGLHWQSLAYSIWEQMMGVAMIIALLAWFRKRFNQQGKLARGMSATAYTAYIIHAPVIILLALALSDIQLEMGLKFVLVAPFAVSLSFLIGHAIKKLPFTRGIL